LQEDGLEEGLVRFTPLLECAQQLHHRGQVADQDATQEKNERRVMREREREEGDRGDKASRR
jgi:hypothetical protein